jgi:hypothetical protein
VSVNKTCLFIVFSEAIFNTEFEVSFASVKVLLNIFPLCFVENTNIKEYFSYSCSFMASCVDVVYLLMMNNLR